LEVSRPAKSARGLTRRRLVQAAFAAGALAAGPRRAAAAGKAKVVVIGGGFGGTTAAKYLRLADASLDVTLVEPNRRYVTCPASNYVLAGIRRVDDLVQGYDTLARRHGVQLAHDWAREIDPDKRMVTLAGGGVLSYDRLIVAPGIDIRWGAIDGYDERAAARMPHAWTAGDQITLLRRQLETMDDGGTFIIAAPSTPYRCPPGPYERASLAAYYFKQAKPRAKILILDSKDQFSEQPLFEEAWKRLYGGMIEWVPLSQDGRITEAQPAEMTVVSEFGEAHRGAVINIVPPQRAGLIAREAGLANDTGWCPVDPLTFESTLHPGIHVIGDSCLAGAMPKGAFSANTQAKVAAYAVASRLSDRPMPVPTYMSSCYSLAAPDYGFSVIDVFHATPQGIMPVPDAGGGSRRDAGAELRAEEARYAAGWYASITAEIWRS
jgi:sulfide dehydrogenase [flavocytochrome c] flavoprotein chain